MRKRDIHVLYCFGGNKNFGDDYILDCWIRFASVAAPDKKIVVNSPVGWMLPFYADNPNVVFNNFLGGIVSAAIAPLKKDGRELGIVDYIAAGRAAAETIMRDHGVWRDFLGRVSGFQICGGGYLNNLFKGAYATASAMAHLARALGVPAYATGLGLLPLDEGIPELDDFFAMFEIVEVRDKESFAYLEQNAPSARSRFGLDDTFLMDVRAAQQPRRMPALYLNIQSDMNLRPLHKDILARLEPVVKRDRDSFSEIRYLCFFSPSDDVFLAELRKLYPCVSVYPSDLLFQQGLPFAPGDVCISSRFHCHLLASRSGAKGLYITGKKGYYDIKHASVTNVGSRWKSFSDDDLSAGWWDALEAPAVDESTNRATKQALGAAILAGTRVS
ncbi:hypothetical protein CHELA1G11_11387 [Hyphomicrobiales bacterium]|nr:hypothetical protein CHELA1G11_11387 [Hyphomicrobiales bacterium]CAH1668119.1 hypothetical protein CHELA1G2_12922 [Hyphomicrobiales bacterium]